MNKLRNLYVSAIILLALNLMPESAIAQQIILINGQPTSVILSGDDIKSLVSDQLSDYMKSFGQEPDDEFVKGLITLPRELALLENKKVVSEKASLSKMNIPVQLADKIYMAAIIEPQKNK